MVSMPSPPDPREVAGAQGAANREAAIASSIVNNPNQNTPFGKSEYETTGYEIIKTANGNRTKVPIRTQTVTLSPVEQNKLRLTNQLQTRLLDAGKTQAAQIKGDLSKPISYDDAPGLVGSVGRVPLQNTRAPNELQTGYDSGGPINRNIQDRGDLATTYDSGGNVQLDISDPRAFQRAIGPASAIQQNIDPQPPLQRDIGQAGTVRDFSTGREYQNRYTTGDVGDTRQRTEEAIMSRLTPDFQRDRSRLESQLTNQGLVRGSEAFNTAMDEMRRAETDARMQAVLAGGQELSRDLGERRAAGDFFNQQQQQRFLNEGTRTQMNNAAQAQRFGQQAGRAQFRNQSALDETNRDLAVMQSSNAAQAQQFGQQTTRAQFSNDVAAAETNRDLSRMQSRNMAQAQREAQNAARTQFGNESQLAMTNRDIATMGAENSAQSQANQQNLAQASFGNAALQQDTQNQFAQTQANNQARQGNFSAAMDQAAFQNSSRQQSIQETAARRTQSLNELSAALSGGQVNVPQFAQPFRQGIDAAPIGDYMYQSAAMEQQNAMAGMSGLFGMGSALLGGLPMLLSDERTKTDKKRIGKTDAGTPIYKYRYKGDPSGLFQVGVMAQELQEKQPEAVGEFGGGLLGVDYSKVR